MILEREKGDSPTAAPKSRHHNTACFGLQNSTAVETEKQRAGESSVSFFSWMSFLARAQGLHRLLYANISCLSAFEIILARFAISG